MRRHIAKHYYRSGLGPLFFIIALGAVVGGVTALGSHTRSSSRVLGTQTSPTPSPTSSLTVRTSPTPTATPITATPTVAPKTSPTPTATPKPATASSSVAPAPATNTPVVPSTTISTDQSVVEDIVVEDTSAPDQASNDQTGTDTSQTGGSSAPSTATTLTKAKGVIKRLIRDKSQLPTSSQTSSDLSPSEQAQIAVQTARVFSSFEPVILNTRRGEEKAQIVKGQLDHQDVYVLAGQVNRKLFGLIPIHIEHFAVVSAQTNQLLEVIPASKFLSLVSALSN